jgi:hypothetical protein
MFSDIGLGAIAPELVGGDRVSARTPPGREKQVERPAVDEGVACLERVPTYVRLPKWAADVSHEGGETAQEFLQLRLCAPLAFGHECHAGGMELEIRLRGDGLPFRFERESWWVVPSSEEVYLGRMSVEPKEHETSMERRSGFLFFV